MPKGVSVNSEASSSVADSGVRLMRRVVWILAKVTIAAMTAAVRRHDQNLPPVALCNYIDKVARCDIESAYIECDGGLKD